MALAEAVQFVKNGCRGTPIIVAIAAAKSGDSNPRFSTKNRDMVEHRTFDPML